MIDLGSYGVVNQSFEYLVYSRGDLELSPGLAESWEPKRGRLGVDPSSSARASRGRAAAS
jgi:hypothetical protein